MAVQISVNTETYVTQRADPDDEWDRDNTARDITDVTAVYKELDDDRYDIYPSNAKNGDVVYVVIAVYDTGDTFGHDDGMVEVLNVFDNESEARSFREHMQDFHVVPRWRGDGKNPVATGDEFSCDHYDKTFYIPWNGYFEHLQDIKIAQVIVGHGAWL